MKHAPSTRRRIRIVASLVAACATVAAVSIAVTGAHTDLPLTDAGLGPVAEAAASAGPVGTVITPLAVAPDEAAPVLEASAPVRLTIAAIGVDTELMDLGLMPDGTLEVPPDGTLAGWYTGAPTPGERGPAVIAGHVDWIGPAVFHDLSLMVPGDTIDVTRADGSVAAFVVTEVGQYAKSAFPTEAVYGSVEVAALRLITCGGVFDDAIGHYDDNVVVYAELVQPS